MTDSPKSNEPFLLDAIHRAGQPNYLGDPAVVAGIVRDFISQWAAFSDTLPAVDAVREWVKPKTDRLADVFLGRSTDYTPMPGWNAPGGIDNFIKNELLYGGDTPEDILEAYFTWMLLRFAKIEERFIDGLVDQDELQAELDDLIQQAARHLMGTDTTIPD